MNDKPKKLTINNPTIPNLLKAFDKNLTQGIGEKISSDENTREGEIIQIDKPLFKKTLSRLVAMQILHLIFEDDEYSKSIGKIDISKAFDEMLNFVEENNNLEWGYFRQKQLSRNLIRSLILYFNEHFTAIDLKLRVHNAVFKNNTTIKALTYCAYSEYLMILSKNHDGKNYQSILTNEYTAISEYFLNSNEIRFFNGILDGIFDTVEKPHEVLKPHEILNTGCEKEIAEE